MAGILDGVVVGLLLLISVGYVALSLGPKSLRRRLRGAAAAEGNGTCGGCSNCGSPQTAQPTQSEVRVPVTQVGRRS